MAHTLLCMLFSLVLSLSLLSSPPPPLFRLFHQPLSPAALLLPAASSRATARGAPISPPLSLSSASASRARFAPPLSTASSVPPLPRRRRRLPHVHAPRGHVEQHRRAPPSPRGGRGGLGGRLQQRRLGQRPPPRALRRRRPAALRPLVARLAAAAAAGATAAAAGLRCAVCAAAGLYPPQQKRAAAKRSVPRFFFHCFPIDAPAREGERARQPRARAHPLKRQRESGRWAEGED